MNSIAGNANRDYHLGIMTRDRRIILILQADRIRALWLPFSMKLVGLRDTRLDLRLK